MGFFRACSLALVLALSMLLPAVAGAQTAGEWTSKGPFCAFPYGLATAKGITAPAYMAVGGSLFRSLDGWATWSRVGAELPASYLSAVAVSPQNARLVYFAIWDGGGVFRSSDGGETWRPVFRNLPARSLVHDVMVPAGPVGTVFALTTTGVYRSRDRGETWKDISPEQLPANFYEVIAHPLHPERLAVQTSRGLWRSHDGGDTWNLWTAGLPPDSSGSPGGAGLSGLTVAPGNQDVAFVTVYQTLYRSQGGKPWKRIGQVPVNSFAYVNTLLVLPGAPAVLLAGQNGGDTTATPGVLRSRDGGKTWQPLSLPGETVLGLRYLPEVGRVVALTLSGAFYSSDVGTTWKRTGHGVVAARVRSLATTGGQVLVAGLEGCPGGGIARSSDGGKTWQVRDTRVPEVYYGSRTEDVEVLASAPSRPLRMYAGVTDEVLRSEDGGITWAHSQFNDGISGGRTAAIAVHPKDPNLVFVAGQRGLSRSRDGGRTWSSVLSDDPFDDMTAVVFDPGQPQRMLAASWYGSLTRSVDAGATWQPVPNTDFLRLGAMAFHPRDSNLVLAFSLFEDVASIYRSADGGFNWTPSDAGIEGVIRGLTFSANGAEVVAAGDEGVFRSTDGGRTWQRVAGGPAGARAVLLQGNGIVHVGTGEGVFSKAGAASP